MSRGNIRALIRAVPGAIPIMSFDDPGGAAGSLGGMEMMFAEDDARPPVLRAHHDCFGGPFRELMARGVVDMIHFEPQFAPNLVDGNEDELRAFFDRAGLFNVGVIPNDQDTLAALAAQFRPAISGMVKGSARNEEVVEVLDAHKPEAAKLIRDRFSAVVKTLADGSGRSERNAAEHCAVSSICGMGDLADLRLQRLALLLADQTSDAIQQKYK